MAKGNEAKEKFINKVISQNKDNYVGCFDKKYYFWSEENGERVQIAVSMTCPKNPVGEVSISKGGGIDFTAPKTVAPTVHEPAEITEEEQENIKALMQRLGL